MRRSTPAPQSSGKLEKKAGRPIWGGRQVLYYYYSSKRQKRESGHCEQNYSQSTNLKLDKRALMGHSMQALLRYELIMSRRR